MIYQPKRHSYIWDTWLYYHNGVHYLYMLSREAGGPHSGVTLATSRDGVHFDEVGEVIRKRSDASWLGTGSVWRTGDRFVMNFSEERGGVQAIYFAVSDDLVHWERLGDEYKSAPDPRWYDNTQTGRWDCIWALPREEGGFYGYLTARPWSKNRGRKCESVGMLESGDGLDWRSVPPPVIDWGDMPEANVSEVGAIEKLGDRYYLMIGYHEGGALGDRQTCPPYKQRYLGMYCFSGDSPTGPFSPDGGAYRMLVSNGTYFSRFYPTPDGLLVNHHSFTLTGEMPNVWLAPLKKAVICADGGMRLGYWQGNDALKGGEIEIDLAGSETVYPSGDREGWELGPVGITADEPHRGGVILLGNSFDTERGFILEGRMQIDPAPKHWGGIGFIINHEDGGGTGIMAETRKMTETGPIRNPGEGEFAPDDAADFGITPSEPHSFRLFMRMSMAELYIDDLLIKCLSLPARPSGRIGLIFESGRARFGDLAAWEMK